MRRTWAFFTMLAIVSAACSGTANSPDPTTPPVTGTPPTEVPGSTDGTTRPSTPSSGSTTTSVTTSNISPELQAAIDELIAVTEDIRELRFKERPTVVFVTEAELAERVRNLIEEELEPDELARDEAALSLLGILEEDVDLRQLYLDLYGGVVAGYYDPEEKELVVPATDGALTASQKVTLVHELTHALTDQHFDFGTRSESLDDEQRYEEGLALSGVVEGDATLTEVLYFNSLSSSDQQDVLRSSGGDPNALAGVPRYIQELLFFPYTTGAEFAVDLWQSDGFRAIDQAYQSPPTTTEQILDPDAYRDGEAGLAVDLPLLELDGYELGEESVWGETGIDAMLGQSISAGTADRAADGWGGDRYQIYFDGENAVFVFSYRGDTDDDAEELFDAIEDYHAAAVGSDAYRFVQLDGDAVLWILADDAAAGAAAQAVLAP